MCMRACWGVGEGGTGAMHTRLTAYVLPPCTPLLMSQQPPTLPPYPLSLSPPSADSSPAVQPVGSQLGLWPLFVSSAVATASVWCNTGLALVAWLLGPGSDTSSLRKVRAASGRRLSRCGCLRGWLPLILLFALAFYSVGNSERCTDSHGRLCNRFVLVTTHTAWLDKCLLRRVRRRQCCFEVVFVALDLSWECADSQMLPTSAVTRPALATGLTPAANCVLPQ